MKLFILLITLALFSPVVNGAKILGLFGFSSQSHNNVFTALTKELAVRGHELTVVTPYPLKDPPGKYRQIETAEIRDIVKKTDNMTTLNMFQRFSFMTNILFNTCSQVLQHPELKPLLNEHFDLILFSIAINDCMIPFAYRLKAPFITMSPAGLISFTSSKMGNPEPSSFVPNLFLPYSDHMTFWERSVNFLFTLFVQLMRDFFYIPKMNKVAKDFFGNDIPSIEEIEINASLSLINNHVSLNYPRPLNPNIIEVGGMHIKQTPDPLPKDIQGFLDGANDGAIYFSMGSMLRGDKLPPEKVHEILQAFSQLKQRVLWKWESDVLPGQPSNVKLGKWLPQQSILAHPNVRLFVTHGGLLSTQESLFHGVPIVGIPIFGDQHLNMRRSEELGYALTIEFSTISKDTFRNALQTVLTNSSFSEMAQRLKKRIRDQPETPLERAVFWTEYVLRHEGAHHLRSAATRLYWFQYHMLDFAAFVLLLTLLPVLVIRAGLLRKIHSTIYSTSPKVVKSLGDDKVNKKSKQDKKQKKL
ncbi:UDP-glycosyltransferase-17 [Ephemera danica]|nr:UDP-glycosyltransferase-17 [Ephemera danica]